MNIFLFFLGLVTVSAWIDHTDDHYLNYDPYPPFAQFLGWGIELFSVSTYCLFLWCLPIREGSVSRNSENPKTLEVPDPKIPPRN